MNDDLHHTAAGGNASGALPASRRRFTEANAFPGWLRAARWLPALMAALLWLTLVYGLPLQNLRESRRIAKG